MRLYKTWLLLFVYYVTSNEMFSISTGRPYVATITDIPHHVLVVYSNLYCSGTLLRSKIVITTAGCVVATTPQKTMVKVGGNSITSLGQVIAVVEIKIHEYFRYYSQMDNDIAMLVLKENVQLNDNVKKVLLANKEEKLDADYLIEVSGWGRQSLPQKYANMLLRVDMIVMQRNHCVEAYKNLITPSNYCAKYQADGHLFDIGGPATHKQRLVGLFSFPTTKSKPYVAVITNTTYFEKWIQLNTKRLLEKYCVADNDFLQNYAGLSD